jgi:hypothetical protein
MRKKYSSTYKEDLYFYSVFQINKPLAQIKPKPLNPQLFGEPNSKSPRIGGFRGHSWIRARDIMSEWSQEKRYSDRNPASFPQSPITNPLAAPD